MISEAREENVDSDMTVVSYVQSVTVVELTQQWHTSGKHNATDVETTLHVYDPLAGTSLLLVKLSRWVMTDAHTVQQLQPYDSWHGNVISYHRGLRNKNNVNISDQ